MEHVGMREVDVTAITWTDRVVRRVLRRAYLKGLVTMDQLDDIEDCRDVALAYEMAQEMAEHNPYLLLA